MRGYRGTQLLLAKQIAMDASTPEKPYTPLDAAPWFDMDNAMSKAKEKNPHDLDPEVVEELAARGIKWSK